MFDRDWNDFFGYMIYNTPGTGLGDDDNEDQDDEDEDW